MSSRVLLILSFLFGTATLVSSRCRSQPGDPSFPLRAEWDALNDTIEGRLLDVIPSAKACAELQCTDMQWASSVFRSTIPGQMNQVGSINLISAISFIDRYRRV
jgi:hypothetical protein